MKKTLLVTASVLLAVASVQAQGLVNFNNSSAASSKISTNAVAGGAATGLLASPANSFYFALFASTSSTANGGTAAVVPTSGAIGTYVSSDGNWTSVGLATNNGTLGRILGNTVLALPTQSGFAGGNTVQLEVVGWSVNLGSTLAAALSAAASGNYVGNAYIGQSSLGSVVLGDGANITTPTVLSAATVPGFTVGLVPSLVPTPEPATLALAGLSGASLLLFRRRK